MSRMESAGSVWRPLIFALLLVVAGSGQAQMARWDAGSGVVAGAGRGDGQIFIVHHQAPPLALYDGGIDGLAATAAFARGEPRLDSDSQASAAYLSFLAAEHAALIAAAEARLGRPLQVLHRLRYASSGFVARMSLDEARQVAALNGVRRVSANVPMQLETDNGPAWIEADHIHDGSGTLDGLGTLGEGIVIGVIDTGVNFDHPAFAEVGPVDGYVHVNPRTDPITGQPRYFGQCDPVTGAPFCNDKLIGVWDFTGTTPHDDNGHGSHTASTAAGNVLDASLSAPTIDFARRISGVAPHANLITYKGCITTPAAGNCAPSGLLPVIDQAVADGVDVINFSIGGTSSDPWQDGSALAFLAARAAGIFVATSAGNSGPKAATLGSPADAPWLLSVAASTHDRRLGNALVGMSGGSSAPPADISGKSLTGPLPQAAIVYAGDFGDPLCGTPFPAGTFSGQIVVCDRGTFGRVEKSENVAAGGAGGYVLANDEGNGEGTSADAFPIPGVHISYADGLVLKAWLADGGSGHQGAILGTQAVVANANGDVMASFSSRGPNPSVPDLVKPDVTAPGVDILAAYNTDLSAPGVNPEYGVISGTSMSSPHAAGAAALLRALHPDWSPAQIQSALMTTAFNIRGRTGDLGLVKEDGVTAVDAFDLGSGRIALARAAQAGVLLDESAANYQAADPAAGGNVAELNLASLGHGNCIGSCAWTRTLSGARAASWSATISSAAPISISVEPASFNLAVGATQELQITADVSGLTLNQWVFGEVLLSPDDPSIPQAHLPFAIRVGPVPRVVHFQVESARGSVSVDDVISQTDISGFTATISGMLPALRTERLVVQDPTPLDPYDGPHSGPEAADPATGSFFILVDVPAGGGKLLDTRISATTAADLDLYVGLDANGDGQPSADEEICASASETALEHCGVQAPVAGTYWVLVQNWLTGSVPDSVTLDTVIVAAQDLGNLSASAPAQTAARTPFPVTLSWNEPDFAVGDTWVGLVEMSSGAAQATDVGTLIVELEVVALNDPGDEPEPTPTPAPAQPPVQELETPQRGGALDWLGGLLVLGLVGRRQRPWSRRSC